MKGLLSLYEEHTPHFMKYHQDDQSVLSVYFIDNKLIHWLDERFNRLWVFWKDLFYPNFQDLDQDTRRIYVQRFIHLNYFTHFTSGLDIEHIV